MTIKTQRWTLDGVIREDASKSVSDHGARDSARLKRKPQQRQHETRRQELARSREKRVDVLREREEDRESNWTKVAIGSDTSEVEDVSISHRWT
jgi:hypothetical protein